MKTKVPQENGQAKATNKTFVQSLKRRLKDEKRKWADELLKVMC